MVADALLAIGFQRVLVEIETRRCDPPQVLFDYALVLRGRRNEAGVYDGALGIEPVAMIEDAARRLGARIADRVARGSAGTKARAGGS